MSNVCKAYKNLDEKLREQCTQHLLFHPNKQFGAFPGMYEPHHIYKDEQKPKQITSHFFRGGIISTMAVFEAFLIELLEEACTDNGHTDKNERTKKLKTNYNNQAAGKGDDKESVVLFHKWNKLYGIHLFKDKHNLLVEYLFLHPMIYNYVINNDQVSEIKIGGFKPMYFTDDTEKRRERRAALSEHPDTQDESIICALLRLFYGIRCVMAHGDPKQTLEKYALKGFPCEKTRDGGCHGKKTQMILEASSDLESYIQRIKSQVGKNAAEKIEDKLRRIPKLTKLEEIRKEHQSVLTDTEWDDALRILNENFSNPNEDPLPAPFAFYHMCRVDQWLRDMKIDMYITYRLLVRVNQFIHMLAFRLTIAVATILEEEHGLPSGFWEIPVPKSNPEDNGEWKNDNMVITKDETTTKAMIERFEHKHKKIVAEMTKEKREPPIQGIDEIKKALENLKINQADFTNDDYDVWKVEKLMLDKDDNERKEYVIKSYLSVVVKKKN